MADAKAIAEQLVIHAMTEIADKDLTGEEKLDKVCEFIVTLDDGIIGLNFIPNALEAELLEVGVDEIKKFVEGLDVKAFVQKQYDRVKYVFKKLIHKV